MKKSIKRLFDLNSLIIASTMFAGNLLSAIFNLYYIKVFLTIYHLDSRWLNIAQILFAIWNAINDPLFGCVQDVGFAWCPRWVMNRRKVILYMAPIYVLSFMVFWFPWSTTGQPSWLIGMHLLVALFFYDSMISFVLSAHCGLFTESTTHHHDRVRVVVYMEMAELLSGFVILPVDVISKSLSDFRAFQISTGVVALIALGFFLITGFFASDKVAQMKGDSETGRMKPATAGQSLQDGKRAAIFILKNRDFWCAVAGNFFHILRMTADLNFLAILTEALLSPNGVLTLGSTHISLFYTGCSVFSKAFLIMCWPILHRFGAFTCLMITLAISAVNCIVTVVIGRTYYSWLALFFLFENILAKGLWPAVYNVFFPDIIDEDMIRHKRKSPLSTMIFTMNALFTKPAQSIAPMIVVGVLNGAGYRAYLQSKDSLATCNTTLPVDQGQNGTNCTFPSLSANGNGTITEQETENFDYLFSTMFYVACLFPLACALLEAACFLPYRLKFRHRKDKNGSMAKEMQTGVSEGGDFLLE